jgi:ABC-type multidrug transport system ATPase subunit
MSSDLFLSIANVTKSFGAKQALKGVTLDLYKGEIVSLLGVNGAGKTTLSSIIASLNPPTTGDVLLNGISIYTNIIGYRQRISFCPQKPNLHPDLSVREQLICAGRYFLMPYAEIMERSEELMKQFGLDVYANQQTQILSGGYKQRLLIARALMHKPALIILDEPTVALDSPIRRTLWELIKQLKNEGTTIVLTTHYLDEAEYLSDRVVVLDQGVIRMIDTPQNLMSHYSKKNLEDVFLHLLEQEKQECEL